VLRRLISAAPAYRRVLDEYPDAGLRLVDLQPG
jgi:hypothetical protein